MSLEVVAHGSNVAIISGVTEQHPGLVGVELLRRSVGELPESIETVVVAGGRPTPREVDRLLAHARPLATAQSGVDALKRVDAGRVVESLDRRSVYVASLPAVTSRAAIATALAAAGSDSCPIADLVGATGEGIALVDERGELIGPAAS